MEDKSNGLYIRRSQKDYPLSLKLSVVKELESGSISYNCAMRKYGIQGCGTINEWRRKYGTFDLSNTIGTAMVKTPQQKIFELEQKVRLLERQNKFLEQQIVDATDKAGILDKIIEIAETEFKIPIRKKRFPEQSDDTPKKEPKP